MRRSFACWSLLVVVACGQNRPADGDGSTGVDGSDTGSTALPSTSTSSSSETSGSSDDDGSSESSTTGAPLPVCDGSPTAWSTVGMVDERGHPAVGVMADGRVVIAGGRLGTDRLSSAVLYDPADDSIVDLPAMANGHSHVDAAWTSDGIIVAGGHAGVPEGEVLDPARLSWTPLPGRFFVPQQPAVIGLPDGRAFFFGCPGFFGCPPEHPSLYDPDADAVVGAAATAEARYGHGLALDPASGRVLVIGGHHFDGMEATMLLRVDAWDPVGDAFEAVGEIAVARMFPTVTALLDGRILVVGGYDDAGQPLADVELFEPNMGSSVASDLGAPRHSHSATRLGDGSVVIAGGSELPAETGQATPIATAERFVPEAGEFVPLPDLADARYAHGAAAVGDCGVIVVAGADPLGTDPAAVTIERLDLDG